LYCNIIYLSCLDKWNSTCNRFLFPRERVLVLENAINLRNALALPHIFLFNSSRFSTPFYQTTYFKRLRTSKLVKLIKMESLSWHTHINLHRRKNGYDKSKYCAILRYSCDVFDNDYCIPERVIFREIYSHARYSRIKCDLKIKNRIIKSDTFDQHFVSCNVILNICINHRVSVWI